METLEFLMHRVAFMGIPFGEVHSVTGRTQSGASWGESYLAMAQDMRTLAKDAEGAKRSVSAAQAWRWAACAYHAASFDLHLHPDNYSNFDDILRLRTMAREAYLRAVRNDPAFSYPVEIPVRDGYISGYLRFPLTEAKPTPVVVLLNGLDSLCEVEMHSFGDWLLERDLAVLALDLPSSFSTCPRLPRFAVEDVATTIAEWIKHLPRCDGSLIGAFGVSFGGHLVARLLSGDQRFRCGVAISPPAWMGASELRLQRVRLMFACAFNLREEQEIDDLAALINIEHLPAPAGRLLIFQMEQDQLFGREHVAALRAWGGDLAEVRQITNAEHVGTSRIHCWLPEACDWLSQRLTLKEHCDDEIYHLANHSSLN